MGLTVGIQCLLTVLCVCMCAFLQEALLQGHVLLQMLEEQQADNEARMDELQDAEEKIQEQQQSGEAGAEGDRHRSGGAGSLGICSIV